MSLSMENNDLTAHILLHFILSTGYLTLFFRNCYNDFTIIVLSTYLYNIAFLSAGNLGRYLNIVFKGQSQR